MHPLLLKRRNRSAGVNALGGNFCSCRGRGVMNLALSEVLELFKLDGRLLEQLANFGLKARNHWRLGGRFDGRNYIILGLFRKG